MENKSANKKTPAKSTLTTENDLLRGGRTKQVRYARLENEAPAEEEEKQDNYWRSQLPYISSAGAAGSQKEGNVRKHEIYDNTYYIPNSKVRILETPISSSLSFQMLLYYHFFYDIFYFGVIFTTIIYKLWVLEPNIIDILALIVGLIVWFPVELARLNYGYKGNINETVRNYSQILTYI